MENTYQRIAGAAPANRLSAVGMSYRNGSDTTSEIKLQASNYLPRAGESADYVDRFLAAAVEMLPPDIFEQVNKATWKAVDAQKAFDLASKFNSRRHK